MKLTIAYHKNGKTTKFKGHHLSFEEIQKQINDIGFTSNEKGFEVVMIHRCYGVKS